MRHLYFVPRPERQPLRRAGMLDNITVPDNARWRLRGMYRELRTAGVRPETARSILTNALYLGGNATWSGNA